MRGRTAAIMSRSDACFAIAEYCRRAAPVERGFVFADLFGISGARFGLRRRGKRAVALELAQRVHNEARTERGQLVVKRCRRIVRVDRDACGAQHGTRIESRIHLHERDTRLRIARFQRPMDRRGAAPARQQRSMDIDAAVARNVEHLLGQQQPISGDDHHIVRRCSQRFDGRPRFGGILAVTPQRRRLSHRQAVLEGIALDRAGLQLHSAPGRAIRLGENECDGKTRRIDGGERGGRELRRTGKYDAQRMCHEFERICAALTSREPAFSSSS